MTAIQTLDTSIDWQPDPPPIDLIFDDGEPLESNRHRIAMNLLIRSYSQWRGDDQDYFTGGNMFIYYSTSQVRNRDYKGPDFFVVLNISPQPEGSSRQGWVVWEEEGRYPDVIVELLSPSTAQVDRTTKKQLYERVFRTRNYFIYDPFDPTQFTGWELEKTLGYAPLVADRRGWLWSETLGLWLGPWAGTIDREEGVWLRFYDPEGTLVPLPEEAAQQQAEAERQRADLAEQRSDLAEQENQRLRARLQASGLE